MCVWGVVKVDRVPALASPDGAIESGGRQILRNRRQDLTSYLLISCDIPKLPMDGRLLAFGAGLSNYIETDNYLNDSPLEA